MLKGSLIFVRVLLIAALAMLAIALVAGYQAVNKAPALYALVAALATVVVAMGIIFLQVYSDARKNRNSTSDEPRSVFFSRVLEALLYAVFWR
jgi:glucan phosphoethanolaminetransferase (alkaline phosphatase superfamily)